MPVLGRKVICLAQCSIGGAEWADGQIEISIFADTIYRVARVPMDKTVSYLVYLNRVGDGKPDIITSDPGAWDWFNGVHQAPKYEDDDPFHGQR